MLDESGKMRIAAYGNNAEKLLLFMIMELNKKVLEVSTHNLLMNLYLIFIISNNNQYSPYRIILSLLIRQLIAKPQP